MARWVGFVFLPVCVGGSVSVPLLTPASADKDKAHVERKAPAAGRGSLSEPAAPSVPKKPASSATPASLPVLEVSDGAGPSVGASNSPETSHPDGELARRARCPVFTGRFSSCLVSAKRVRPLGRRLPPFTKSFRPAHLPFGASQCVGGGRRVSRWPRGRAEHRGARFTRRYAHRGTFGARQVRTRLSLKKRLQLAERSVWRVEMWDAPQLRERGKTPPAARPCRVPASVLLPVARCLTEPAGAPQPPAGGEPVGLPSLPSHLSSSSHSATCAVYLSSSSSSHL